MPFLADTAKPKRGGLVLASGRTHTKINIAGTLIAAPLLSLFSIYSEPVLFAFCGGSVFGTCFLSPDLDLRQSDSNRAWGGFSFLWHGYHKLFSHRKVSHFLVIGTLSRLFYLWAIGLLLLFLGMMIYWVIRYPDLRGVLHAQVKTGDLVRESTIWLYSNRKLAAGFFSGLVFADALHLISDLIYSFARKRGRGGRLARR